MKKLKLYPTTPTLAVEDCASGTPHDKCLACSLSMNNPTTRCMPAEIGVAGQRGGVLVVYPVPTKDEDTMGRPFCSGAAMRVRRMVEGFHPGPIAYTPAVRCTGSVEDAHVEACRPYMRALVDQLQPDRILVLGSMSALSVIGRKIKPFNARRSYSFTSTGVPVFTLFEPVDAALNKFIRQWLQQDLKWALNATPPMPPWGWHYHLVETAADAEHAARVLRTKAWVNADTETCGVMWEKEFRIVCVSVTGSDLTTFVWTEEAMYDPCCAAPLIALLEDEAVPTTGQNLKYDINAFAADNRSHARCRVRNVRMDSMLGRKVFESDAACSLDAQAELVGMGGAKHENSVALEGAVKSIRTAREELDKRGFMPNKDLVAEPLYWSLQHPDHSPMSFAYGLVNRDVLYRYNARDTVVSAMLSILYKERIDQSESGSLLWNTFMRPATHALARVQEWGMAASKDNAQAFSDYLAVHIEAITRKMFQWGDFDPNSPQSIGLHLFGKLGLPVHSKSKKTGAPSTDKNALKKLRMYHPIVPILEEYRTATKMRSQYADGMIPHIRSDGRIHGSLLIDGTRTGRLSSREPNLLNIPSRGGRMSKMAKDVFIAPRGRVLIQLDYSQIEYRVAAMLADDPVFKQVFIDGHDLHQRTAELISQVAWGIPPEKVTKDHRRAAKTVNFGLFYGMGDKALSELLGCSIAQAKKIREAVLGQFKEAAKWIQSQVAYTMQHGVTWTYWNGKPCLMRQLWNIASPDDYLVSKATNGSYNTPVQGTAAHYGVASLCAMVDWIEKDNLDVKVVNSVYDSIILESKEADMFDTVHIARAIMEQWPADVPIVVDAEVGWTWGNLTDFDKVMEVIALYDAGTPTKDIVDKYRNDDGDETISSVVVDRIGATWGNAP